MCNWLKRDKKKAEAPEESPPSEALPSETEALPPDRGGYLARLRQGLSKTRDGLANLFLGRKQIDQELLDELETLLLTADVGLELTQRLMNEVSARVSRKELGDSEAVRSALADQLAALLPPTEQPERSASPHVILLGGINVAGKTTSIGKLAAHFQAQGKKVMLAAGDTFRAAAVEQLQAWGERNRVPVIAQATGADSASVAFDALQAATARGMDILLVDTAGRLHTQSHLMDELKKIKRVLGRQNPALPQETLLVIDAGNGQNALRQAEQFHEALGLDGIVLTKLDGTAKGGIVFAIAARLGVPIRFIGVGEGREDLKEFNGSAFVRALLYND